MLMLHTAQDGNCTLIQKRYAMQVVCMLRQREKYSYRCTCMRLQPNHCGRGGGAAEMNWNHITLDPEPDCVAVCAQSIKACSEEPGLVTAI